MIYFKDAYLAKNIEELLLVGFQDKQGDSYTFDETFTDSECTKRECKPAFRSFNALLEICQTYFPKTTDVELAKKLFELKGKIYASFCGTINEVVFSASDESDYDEDGNTGNMLVTTDETDDRSLFDAKGNSGISFEDIYNLSIK